MTIPRGCRAARSGEPGGSGQKLSGRTSASVPPSTNRIEPTTNDAAGPSNHVAARGDLARFGPVADRHRDLAHQRSELGVVERGLGQRRVRVAGCERVEPHAGGGPLGRLPADPAGQRELDARVRDAALRGERDRGRFVAGEARGDEVVVDRRDGRRARAHGDRRRGLAAGQRVAQPFEHRDAPEVADGREQVRAGRRWRARPRTPRSRRASRRTRRAPPRSRRRDRRRCRGRPRPRRRAGRPR